MTPFTNIFPRFQPTLPARGATDTQTYRNYATQISTHAPRTGSDSNEIVSAFDVGHFNPRSPHGERRPHKLGGGAATTRFQPTLPARGATDRQGGGDSTPRISTHAPRTGSDATSSHQPPEGRRFQPTLPARGATKGRKRPQKGKEISTHAPRTGSDRVPRRGGRDDHISTHAPRTGSDIKFGENCIAHIFQPTLPARGATPFRIYRTVPDLTFQPTLPARGATRRQLPPHVRVHISTHAPRTGSDGESQFEHTWLGLFQPTLPARGATSFSSLQLI